MPHGLTNIHVLAFRPYGHRLHYTFMPSGHTNVLHILISTTVLLCCMSMPSGLPDLTIFYQKNRFVHAFGLTNVHTEANGLLPIIHLHITTP